MNVENIWVKYARYANKTTSWGWTLKSNGCRLYFSLKNMTKALVWDRRTDRAKQYTPLFDWLIGWSFTPYFSQVTALDINGEFCITPHINPRRLRYQPDDRIGPRAVIIVIILVEGWYGVWYRFWHVLLFLSFI